MTPLIRIYAERYGRNPDPATEWEVISIQIIGEGEVQAYSPKSWRAKRGGGEGPGEVRKVWFEKKWRETSVFDRMELEPRSKRGRPRHYRGERSHDGDSSRVARRGPRERASSAAASVRGC